MMTIAEICRALDKTAPPASVPHGNPVPGPDGKIVMHDPDPASLIVLCAQDVAAARKEAKTKWEQLHDAEAQGYLVFQSDGICVDALELLSQLRSAQALFAIAGRDGSTQSA